MATRLIDLPFTRGLDQSVDETSLAPPGLTELVNYRMTRQGRLEHRLGVVDQDTEPTIFDGVGDKPDGSRAQALLGRFLAASGHGFSCLSSGVWVNAGSLSRYVPIDSTQGIQSSSLSYRNPSCASAAGYLVVVGNVESPTGTVIRVFDESTGALVFSQTINDVTAIMSRVVAAGDSVVVLRQVTGNFIFANSLDLTVFPLALSATVDTGAFQPAVTAGFDVAPLDADSFLLSYYDFGDAVLAIVDLATLLVVGSAGRSDDVGTKLTTCFAVSPTALALAWHNVASGDVCCAIFDAGFIQIGTTVTCGTAPGTSFSTDRYHPVLGRRDAQTAVVGWTDSYESAPYATYRTTFCDVDVSTSALTPYDPVYGYYLASKIFTSDSPFVESLTQPAVWLGNHNPNVADLDRSYYLMTVGFFSADTLNAACAWEMSASPSAATGAVANLHATRQVSDVVRSTAPGEPRWQTVFPEAFRGLATASPQIKLQVYRFADAADSVAARTRCLVPHQAGLVVLGGAPRCYDSDQLIEVGMSHGPALVAATPTPTGGMTVSGSYHYIFVLEYFDGEGRRQLSYASGPYAVTLGGGDGSVDLDLAVPAMWAFPNTTRATLGGVSVSTTRARGIVLRAYRTSNNGTVYRYSPATGAPNGVSAGPLADNGRVTYTDANSDAAIAANEAVYVQVGNNLSNYRAPPCTFGCEHEGRLVVGGGWRRSDVICSKLFFSGEGIQFTESAALVITMPEDCTGVASLDGSLILFSARGIYSVSGDGPTDDGVGAFPRPRRLPGRAGCVDWRSIVTTEAGVFFRSLDGLYLLPRGLGAPVFVGAPVKEKLRQYPETLGAASVTRALATSVDDHDSEQVVCWLVADAAAPTAVTTMVFSVATGTWSETRLPEDAANLQTVIGQWTDLVNNTDVVAWARATIATATAGSLLVESPSAGYDQDISGTFEPLLNGSLKTGKIFPFGFGGRGSVRAVRLVGDCLHATTVTPTVYSDANAAGYTAAVLTLAAGRFAVELPLRQRDLAWLQVALADPTTGSANRGAGLRFNGLAIEVEMEPGIHRTAPTSRST